MKTILLILSLTLSGLSLACTEDGKEGFLPENDLYIPANAKQVGGITEAQFNAVIDQYEAIYVPLAKKLGGNLKIARHWDNGTVNANAMRVLKTWNVNMYGGLARHSTITPDGFALVLCHEIGHHMGGAPKVGMLLQRWASNEGQSDYFATLKCLRRAWQGEDNEAVVARLNAPEFLVDSCAKAYASRAEQNICIRAAMAGDSVSGLFASMRSRPRAQFHTPDPNVVGKTDDSHPAHQCRLDTYFQGALCDVDFKEDVSQRDERTGTCHALNGHSTGLRPLCWFKPKER
jgi:hypothetical protein